MSVRDIENLFEDNSIAENGDNTVRTFDQTNDNSRFSMARDNVPEGIETPKDRGFCIGTASFSMMDALSKRADSGDTVFISIARKTPDGIDIPQLDELAPSSSILYEYRNAEKYTESGRRIAEVKYLERMKNERYDRINRKALLDRIDSIRGGRKNVILLCYEKSGVFCHRYSAMDFIEGRILTKEEENERGLEPVKLEAPKSRESLLEESGKKLRMVPSEDPERKVYIAIAGYKALDPEMAGRLEESLSELHDASGKAAAIVLRVGYGSPSEKIVSKIFNGGYEAYKPSATPLEGEKDKEAAGTMVFGFDSEKDKGAVFLSDSTGQAGSMQYRSRTALTLIGKDKAAASSLLIAASDKGKLDTDAQTAVRQAKMLGIDIVDIGTDAGRDKLHEICSGLREGMIPENMAKDRKAVFREVDAAVISRSDNGLSDAVVAKKGHTLEEGVSACLPVTLSVADDGRYLYPGSFYRIRGIVMDDEPNKLRTGPAGLYRENGKVVYTQIPSDEMRMLRATFRRALDLSDGKKAGDDANRRIAERIMKSPIETRDKDGKAELSIALIIPSSPNDYTWKWLSDYAGRIAALADNGLSIKIRGDYLNAPGERKFIDELCSSAAPESLEKISIETYGRADDFEYYSDKKGEVPEYITIREADGIITKAKTAVTVSQPWTDALLADNGLDASAWYSASAPQRAFGINGDSATAIAITSVSPMQRDMSSESAAVRALSLSGSAVFGITGKNGRDRFDAFLTELENTDLDGMRRIIDSMQDRKDALIKEAEERGEEIRASYSRRLKDAYTPGADNASRSMIGSFTGEMSFLSDYHIEEGVTIHYSGLEFPSVHNAYLAASCLRKDDMKRFVGISPKEADSLMRSGSIEKRPDWDNAKEDVLRTLLKEKYADKNLMDRLAATGSAMLINGNSYDKDLGSSRGRGRNLLGRLQEELRDEHAKSLSREAYNSVSFVPKDSDAFRDAAISALEDMDASMPSLKREDRYGEKAVSGERKTWRDDRPAGLTPLSFIDAGFTDVYDADKTCRYLNAARMSRFYAGGVSERIADGRRLDIQKLISLAGIAYLDMKAYDTPSGLRDNDYEKLLSAFAATGGKAKEFYRNHFDSDMEELGRLAERRKEIEQSLRYGGSEEGLRNVEDEYRRLSAEPAIRDIMSLRGSVLEKERAWKDSSFSYMQLFSDEQKTIRENAIADARERYAAYKTRVDKGDYPEGTADASRDKLVILRRDISRIAAESARNLRNETALRKAESDEAFSLFRKEQQKLEKAVSALMPDERKLYNRALDAENAYHGYILYSPDDRKRMLDEADSISKEMAKIRQRISGRTEEEKEKMASKADECLTVMYDALISKDENGNEPDNDMLERRLLSFLMSESKSYAGEGYLAYTEGSKNDSWEFYQGYSDMAAGLGYAGMAALYSMLPKKKQLELRSANRYSEAYHSFRKEAGGTIDSLSSAARYGLSISTGNESNEKVVEDEMAKASSAILLSSIPGVDPETKTDMLVNAEMNVSSDPVKALGAGTPALAARESTFSRLLVGSAEYQNVFSDREHAAAYFHIMRRFGVKADMMKAVTDRGEPGVDRASLVLGGGPATGLASPTGEISDTSPVISGKAAPVDVLSVYRTLLSNELGIPVRFNSWTSVVRPGDDSGNEQEEEQRALNEYLERSDENPDKAERAVEVGPVRDAIDEISGRLQEDAPMPDIAGKYYAHTVDENEAALGYAEPDVSIYVEGSARTMELYEEMSAEAERIFNAGRKGRDIAGKIAFKETLPDWPNEPVEVSEKAYAETWEALNRRTTIINRLEIRNTPDDLGNLMASNAEVYEESPKTAMNVIYTQPLYRTPDDYLRAYVEERRENEAEGTAKAPFTRYGFIPKRFMLNADENGSVSYDPDWSRGAWPVYSKHDMENWMDSLGDARFLIDMAKLQTDAVSERVASLNPLGADRYEVRSIRMAVGFFKGLTKEAFDLMKDLPIRQWPLRKEGNGRSVTFDSSPLVAEEHARVMKEAKEKKEAEEMKMEEKEYRKGERKLLKKMEKVRTEGSGRGGRD